MNVLYAASEAVPFCKTGGLADVAGSLPPALAEQGVRTAVILPLYQRVKEAFGGQLTFRCFDYVDLAWRHAYCGLFSMEKDGVTWFFFLYPFPLETHSIYFVASTGVTFVAI